MPTTMAPTAQSLAPLSGFPMSILHPSSHLFAPQALLSIHSKPQLLPQSLLDSTPMHTSPEDPQTCLPKNTSHNPEALWESRLSHNSHSGLPSAFTSRLQGLLMALPVYLPVPANHHLQEPLLGLSPVPIHSKAATGIILCNNPARSLS